MSRVISSLLIAVLLACPLLCGWGHGAARAAGKAESHGCSCCHDEGPTNGDSRPGDKSPSRSGHSCQCICGGAVVNDAGVQSVEFDWTWSLPVTMAELVIISQADDYAQAMAHTPWPDVGMNHGRALCCLYNTFLC